jgi:group I intron endonuclease
MLESGIYQIRGPNKVYIGQAQNVRKRFIEHRTRLNCGRHHNPILQRAWKKHGPEAFVFEALGFFPIDELDDAEQFLLDRLPEDGKYNISTCVEVFSRGLKRSAETRARMSKALLGNKRGLGKQFGNERGAGERSTEACARMSNALLGNKRGLGKRSAETRAKMSLASLGKPKSAAHREKIRIASSRPENVERMRAIALSRTGKPGRVQSNETKQRLSAIQKDIWAKKKAGRV